MYIWWSMLGCPTVKLEWRIAWIQGDSRDSAEHPFVLGGVVLNPISTV